jgi:hypothetical protein
MKLALALVCRLVGVVLMLAAFWKWISFDYPDVNPFSFGAAFAPGMLSQALNWILVCILATAGWGMFTLGKFRIERKKSSE